VRTALAFFLRFQPIIMGFRDSDDSLNATEAGASSASTDHQDQNPRRKEEGWTPQELAWLMRFKLGF
jgi:hypothetical protein